MTYDLPKGATALFVVLEPDEMKWFLEIMNQQIHEVAIDLTKLGDNKLVVKRLDESLVFEIEDNTDTHSVFSNPIETPFSVGSTIETTQGKRVVESLRVVQVKDLVYQEGIYPDKYEFFTLYNGDTLLTNRDKREEFIFTRNEKVTLDSWGIYCQLK